MHTAEVLFPLTGDDIDAAAEAVVDYLNIWRKRRCPSCDGQWLLDEPLHSKFDFKCDGCRLLSNIAYSLA